MAGSSRCRPVLVVPRGSPRPACRALSADLPLRLRSVGASSSARSASARRSQGRLSSRRSSSTPLRACAKAACVVAEGVLADARGSGRRRRGGRCCRSSTPAPRAGAAARPPSRSSSSGPVCGEDRDAQAAAAGDAVVRGVRREGVAEEGVRRLRVAVLEHRPGHRGPHRGSVLEHGVADRPEARAGRTPPGTTRAPRRRGSRCCGGASGRACPTPGRRGPRGCEPGRRPTRRAGCRRRCAAARGPRRRTGHDLVGLARPGVLVERVAVVEQRAEAQLALRLEREQLLDEGRCAALPRPRPTSAMT